ncbi:MAG: LuxR C-terminal-related transcriptional regulator [Actinomycetota bacterium]|nr:LuxR C-terminal-related transcriptional regulator [Actinomycetota bacterium]
MEECARACGPSSVLGFVGRQAELEVLTDRLHRLAGGLGGAIVIEGEPGVGTSRLVQEALRQAGRDIRVLHSAGHGHRLLRSLVPELAAGTRHAAASVARELARLTREVPVALVLEDLDRADPAFLSLVQRVAVHLEDQAVLLVVTARPAPRPPKLDQLLADLITDGAAHLRLRGLDPVETTLLATAVAGTDPETARAVLDRTGGNPQLVVELVRALVADGVLAGRAEVPPSLPASLRPLLLGRLARLPRSTVDLLRVAAVLGPRFEVTHLARFIREPAVRLLPRLEDALLAGVLDQVGPHLTIRPGLVRDALYDDIAPALRSALHVEASRVLAEAGAPTSTLAEHLVSAAATGDPAVLRRLRAVAQDTLSGSPAAAADLLRRASGGAGSELRDTLLGDLVVAQLWSGRPGDAERMAREFLERPHDPTVGDIVRLTLVEAVHHQGRYQEAAREAATLLAEKDLSARVRARLRASYALALLLDGDPAGAGDAAATAAREADQLRDPRAASTSRVALAGVALGAGRAVLAVELATGAVERARQSRTVTAADSHAVVLNRCTLVTALMLTDRPDAAERAVTDGLRAAETLGNAVAAPSYRLLRAVLRFWTGRWDDAVADAEAGLTAAGAAGVALGVAQAFGALVMIAVHRNELARADDLLAGAATAQASGAHWVEWARGLHEEACGRTEAAAGALRGAWTACTRTGSVVDYPFLGADMVRLLLAVDDQTAAERTAAQVEEVAARTGTATARGSALRCCGLLRGDPRSLGRAARVLTGQAYPLVAAQVSEEAAVAGAGASSDEPSGTVDLLEAARSGFRALGARRDLARVEARLRSIGVRSGRPRPRSRGDGWDSLTTAEREVVALATEGLTNREIAARLFISPRTAETHLTHVFAKLDLQGRPALRLAVARRNGTGSVSAAR